MPAVTELHSRQDFGAQNLPGVEFGNTGAGRTYFLPEPSLS
jgi:hypothetical protein